MKKKSLKKYIYSAIPLLLLGLLLISPVAAAKGAANGLSLSAGVLIPTLLPFLILSAWAVSSGAFSPLERFMKWPIRILFNLPPSAVTPIISGFLSGYPVGARTAALLYEEGALGKRQTQRLLTFCVCASPQFVMSTVGAGLLGSVKAGVIIYVANIISCLLVGVAYGLISRFTTNDDEAFIYKPVKREKKGMM